ncbi:VWA domain-containing protein [Paenibacillus sp. SYP-B3998]|uniref:VWA domain-containing protein n=2 Tax=Paenibacillus sp. SYP-B3998 TaxID=2678564 RepID=A0A6G4A688_9BACL|nr:VWA domain-containing protein [Paenibacillus sp. SYP-B3998]
MLLSFAVFFGVFFSLPAGFSLAKEETEPGVDAVFVMDSSYSMNATDRDRIASEVVKMFMDMSEAAHTRIGFAAYNHKIVESQELTSLATEEQKTILKKKIENLRFSGYTDLGLGLRKGANLIQTGKNSTSRPIMILLSDGGTDFGPISTGRNVEDSNKDVESVISVAQKEGYPIYTVGLNHDGSVNAAQLDKIAAQTGGVSFITESAADLPDIFNKIFAKQIRSVLVPVATITATGDLQEVTVTIPNGSINEANIILLSQHPITETHLYTNANHVRFYKSEKYSLMKMPQPQKGTYLLKFKGSPGDLVKINALHNYNVRAGLELPQVVKGIPAAISAFLLNETDGKKLTDADIYQTLKAELIIKDLSTNQEQRLPMSLKDNGFSVETTFLHSGKYQASLLLSGPDFYREASLQEFELTNTSPEAVGDGNILLTREDGIATLDLSSYFRDVNKDKLSYTIDSIGNEKPANYSINNDGFLLISPARTGESILKLTIKDPEGGTITSSLHVTIRSIWTRYIIIGTIVLGILLIAFLIWLMLRPKPKFVGRLEGYFLNTASGNDVPVKYWPLPSFEKQRTIRLSDLFASLDINEPLPETERITIQAGKQGTLLFKHNTRCSVEKGKLPIPKNKVEILRYNDKIYITFEDHITEVELRYKEIKPSTLS